MKGCLSHIALLTNNPRRLINFYIGKLGFKETKVSVAQAGTIRPIFSINKECRLVVLSRDGINVEIISLVSGRFEAQDKNNTGYNHWSYAVDNKESFLKALDRKKVRIIKARKGERFVYFIKDPDFNLIEIQ